MIEIGNNINTRKPKRRKQKRVKERNWKDNQEKKMEAKNKNKIGVCLWEEHPK